MTTVLAPQVDPESPHGHIVVTRAFLEARFGHEPVPILRAAFTGESRGTPKLYWFEDTVEVRRVLGMESK